MSSPGWAAPSYDALVIGAGLAGLTAATRLAEGGARDGVGDVRADEHVEAPGEEAVA